MKLSYIQTKLDLSVPGLVLGKAESPYVFENDANLKVELYLKNFYTPPSISDSMQMVDTNVSFIRADDFTWSWLKGRCICIPVSLSYITIDSHVILNFVGSAGKDSVCEAICIIRQRPNKTTVFGRYPQIGDKYYLLIDF